MTCIILKSHIFSFFFLLVLLEAVCGEEKVSKSTSELLADAEAAQLTGKLELAEQILDDLLESHPRNQLALAKRAALLTRRRKYLKALDDLDLALEIDPLFVKGLMQRATLQRLRGNLESSLSDYKRASSQRNKKAKEEIPKVESAIFAQNKAIELISGENISDDDYFKSIELLSQVLEIAQESSQVLILQATCYHNIKLYDEVISTTTNLLKVDSNNVDMIYIRGYALYMIEEDESAMKHFKAGLSIDPDHVLLKRIYNKIRSFNRAMTAGNRSLKEEDFSQAEIHLYEASEIDIESPKKTAHVFKDLCDLYVRLRRPKDADEVCTKAIDMLTEYYNEINKRLKNEDVENKKEFDDSELLKLRGEARLLLGEYDSSVSDFTRASKLSPRDRTIIDALKRAEVARKRSKEKNYYDILGVDRNADTSTIKKAYHKLALQLHPDKLTKATEEEREIANKKLMDVNEAAEVLSNDDLRHKFDTGEEVFPSGGQQQQHRGGQFFQFPFGFPGGPGGFPGGGRGGGPGFTFHF